MKNINKAANSKKNTIRPGISSKSLQPLNSKAHFSASHGSKKRSPVVHSSSRRDSSSRQSLSPPLLFNSDRKTFNDSVTLLDSSLSDEYKISVNITTIMGKVFTVQMRLHDQIYDIKKTISEREGIAPDSQMLVFCGKQLEDDFQSLESAKIQDQSTLSLILKMTGGPGPPIQMKRLLQEDDQTIFLICKKNEELYVLEVQLKDCERPKTIAKHHLRIQSPNYGSRLMEFLDSNEFFDISDLCELQVDLEEDESICEYKDDFESSKFLPRPLSGDTISSYLSSKSRPDSGASIPSSIATDDSFGSLLWESESYLSINSPHQFFVPAHSSRPATAISLMRLPSGTRPMVIIPKTRPASAEKWVEGFKSHLEIQLNDIPRTERFSENLPSSLSNPFYDADVYEYEGRRMSTPGIASPMQALKTPIRQNRAKSSKLVTLCNNLNNTSSNILQQFSSNNNLGLAKSRIRPCCMQCSKKLGPAQIFKCKCDMQFCSSHRFWDKHPCTFDWQTAGRTLISLHNPPVKKDKLLRL